MSVFQSPPHDGSWGVALTVGGVCYLADMPALSLVPDVGTKVAAFVIIPSAIAEFWMVGYLILMPSHGVLEGTCCIV